ncbi:MAG: beta-N-acetylhexosaminidase [Myxococcales bacterium]|nr:beta-N-acetylhexosaminidase [Myxococcales bacterium]
MNTATGEATSLADRKRRAGQRLLLGFDGLAVDEDLRRLVAEIRPAGFLLFGRNLDGLEQVSQLTEELASLVNPHHPALLAVDQEGGRVSHLPAPATAFPSMRTVAKAHGTTARVAAAIAREVRACGFNLNFAPVADVDSNPDNPVIGDRSFGSRPEAVAEHVATFVHAHQAEHVIACAKHFPGHGDTDVDSHLALPLVARSESSLRAVELVPFRAAVDAGVGAVMTAHVVLTAFDPELPATLSPRVLPRVLRQELSYDGVVFSDDLTMRAIADHWSIEEQAARTTEATVDVLVMGSDPDRQIELFQSLVRTQERLPSADHSSTLSAKRVHALRERFFLTRTPPPTLAEVGADTHRRLADDVAERSTWS